EKQRRVFGSNPQPKSSITEALIPTSEPQRDSGAPPSSHQCASSTPTHQAPQATGAPSANCRPSPRCSSMRH
ncbi:hypothetical protein U1Q18_032776, partial [Sarracenia purpurea var. burkii]